MDFVGQSCFQHITQGSEDISMDWELNPGPAEYNKSVTAQNIIIPLDQIVMLYCDIIYIDIYLLGCQYFETVNYCTWSYTVYFTDGCWKKLEICMT